MRSVLRWLIDIIKVLDALIALDDLFARVIRLKGNILKSQSSGTQLRMMDFYLAKFPLVLDAMYGGCVKNHVHMDAYTNINKHQVEK